MDYYVYFDDRLAPERIREALAEAYRLALERLFAGTSAELDRWLEDHPDAEYPIARLFQETGTRDEFSCRLEADQALADAIGGIPVLELTTMVCRRLGTRAIFEHGPREIGGWMLVCADGWHGPVDLLEAGHLDAGTRLLGSYHPVPSDRHVYRIQMPQWYSGDIPESGYLLTEPTDDQN